MLNVKSPILTSLVRTVTLYFKQLKFTVTPLLWQECHIYPAKWEGGLCVAVAGAQSEGIVPDLLCASLVKVDTFQVVYMNFLVDSVWLIPTLWEAFDPANLSWGCGWQSPHLTIAEETMFS